MEVTGNDIGEYLGELRKAVRHDRYRIEPRYKNRELYVEYCFSESMCRKILLGLNERDFSEIVCNEHPDYTDELLYVFGRTVTLKRRFENKRERVHLYIKINKIKNTYIIVSFHKREFPLKCRYRKVKKQKGSDTYET